MLRYLRAYALGVIAFHLLSSLFPIEHVWGAGGFPMLPLWLQWTLAVAAVFSFTSPAERAARTACAWCRRVTAGAGREVVDAVLALAAFPLFWLGRLQHLRWGDAYIFANAISHPDVRLTYNWQSPMDLFLHARLWAVTGAAWGWDVQTTYAVVSCLAGSGFVYLLLRSLSTWGRTPSQQLTAAALFLTLGSLQLFFGYVESYTLLPLGILAFLVLGLRFLREEGALWPAATVLALTFSLSLSSLPLLLALVYLAWRARRDRGWGWERVALEAGGPLLLTAMAVLGIMTAGGHGIEALLTHDFPGGGDRSWLVPLFRASTQWQHYTMFSWAHLRDVLNEQMLVAPFGLAAIAGVLVGQRREVQWRDPSLRFLMLAAGAYLLLTVVWNPDYGGRRDWDLFAPASFPITALAVYLLNHYLEPAVREKATVFLTAVSLMHLGPWVWFNAQPWPWE